MKNKKIIVSLIVACCVCIGLITFYLNKKPAQSNKSQLGRPKGSIMHINNLTELKDKSKVIAEVEGTDQLKKIDYKGLPCIISTVKVKEIFKGDKSLKKIKILQVEDIDLPPKKGQKLLVFLCKDTDAYGHEDNPDCYGVVGAGQGIYILEDGTDNVEAGSHNNISNNIIIKPQSIENKDILKELRSGNYEYIKNKLK